MPITIKDIDTYIALHPKETQEQLKKLRQVIKSAVPDAEEVISYRMPAFKYNGMLVYFAAYPNHIGFYPTSSAIEAFKPELSMYKHAKGSVQFPIDKPLPLALIKKMVTFRAKENLKKATTKATKKQSNKPL